MFIFKIYALYVHACICLFVHLLSCVVIYWGGWEGVVDIQP